MPPSRGRRLHGGVDVAFDTGDSQLLRVRDHEPAGEVALGFHVIEEWDVRLYSAAGAPSNAGVGPLQQLGEELDAWLHSTAHGWRGIGHRLGTSFRAFTFTATGETEAVLASLFPTAMAPDGRGGSVVSGRTGA